VLDREAVVGQVVHALLGGVGRVVSGQVVAVVGGSVGRDGRVVVITMLLRDLVLQAGQ
jgi:hypothetical protein